jgi:hypothetical protein
LTFLNLKATVDGEILSFDEKTKAMLQKAVTEIEGLDPRTSEFSKEIVAACKRYKKGPNLTQSLLCQIKVKQSMTGAKEFARPTTSKKDESCCRCFP